MDIIKKQSEIMPTPKLNQEEISALFGEGLTESSVEWQRIKDRIKAQNPDASQEELGVLFVREMYGEEQAQQLIALMQARTKPIELVTEHIRAV